MKNIKNILRITLLFFVIQSASAQSFNPKLAAMLQDTLNYYVSIISDIKGMSASVYLPNQGIWKGTTGLSHTGQPITSDMEFGIASNTKLFVAAAILKLAENKILSLDDSLYKWIPAYKNINPNITIRQLLNHTSGISDPIFLPPYMDSIMNNPTRTYTPNEVLGWLGAPTFNPGVNWGYSNVNYIIAGMIAEKATGYHISKLIRDSILTPLNLVNTFYDIYEPETGVLAHRWFNGVDYKDTSRVGLNTAGGCAGALFSTSEDMVQWYHSLMSGKILKSSSLAQLTTFVKTPGQYTYGLGLMNQTFFGHITWGHDGSTWGYKSRMIYDPCNGVAVCGLANSWPAGMDGITLLLYKTVVDVLPDCPGKIKGPSYVCKGQTSIPYTVPSIKNATTYVWTLPSGASGTSTTNSIKVDFDASATSGVITVKGTNEYGDGGISAYPIKLNDAPKTPTISYQEPILESDASAGNQWYDQNGIIDGANYQTYKPKKNGDYYVIVSLLGCSSKKSNTINVVLSDIEYTDNNRLFKIYPNPVSDELVIEMSGKNEMLNFEIINSIGEVVSKGHLYDKTIIQTSNFPQGLYLIRLDNGKTFEFRKIIKE